MNNDDQNKIEDLNRTLYSRNAPDIRTKRRLHFHEQEVDVRTDWDHPLENSTGEPELNTKYKNTTMSFLTKILITSIIFFLVALGVGTFLVIKGGNIVSANNVDITINGPLSVGGGEPVSFGIQVSNHNNIKLQTVDLAIEYPSGTVDAQDNLKELKNTRELIPDIAPGGIGQKDIKAVIYGEENSTKQIKVSIEYRVTGSNAIFTKEKTFDLLISSSPLTLSVSSFKEVNSGQEFELSVTMNSNSKEIIKNLLLKVAYPFGFTYTGSSVPSITSDNGTWKMGDITPGGKKTLKIRGKLEGQDDEVRIFRFITGTSQIGNEKMIGTEYISNSQEVSIKKPFMSVNLGLNSDSGTDPYIGTFNNPIKVDVNYFNNLPTSIIDAEVHVKLSGSSFDKASVSTDDGLYKSENAEIVWNSITTNNLHNIDAGGSGRVSFNITPKDLSTKMKMISNPNLYFAVSINGKRNSEANVPENIVSTAQRQVKISSNISLGGQTLFATGSFTNTGPIPPQSERQTTYTLVWTIDNSSNSVSNVQVVSSLPAYVKWLGKIDPSEEDITHDAVTGTIVWNVGGLSTYTSGSSKRRQVSFQIALDPSINQVGTTPILLNQSSLTAQDDFTGQTLKSNLSTLTTRYSNEQSFVDGNEKVFK